MSAQPTTGGAPESLLPAVRTLPRLAWVTARGAYTPAALRRSSKRPIDRLLNALGDAYALPQVPYHLAGLLWLHRRGELASRNSRSVLVVVPLASTRRRTPVDRVVIAMGIPAASAAVTWGTGALALRAAGVSGRTAASVSAAALVPAGVSSAVVRRNERHHKRNLVTMLSMLPRASNVFVACSFAAWPQNRVHGGRLLAAALDAAPPRCMVLFTAASPQLRDLYERAAARRGFQVLWHLGDDTAVLLRATRTGAPSAPSTVRNTRGPQTAQPLVR